ncbi:MAG: protein translocase subunit SecD [Patescibacteria group bacterium]
MTDKNNTAEVSPSTELFIRIFRAVVVLGLGGWIAFFVYNNATNPNASYPFKLGLDLAGGSHLVYEADVSGIPESEVPELMSVLRTVIERRVNIFGVSEPIIQVEESSFAAEVKQHRLVVELPGVTDVTQAVAEIGRTPLLEFKLVDEEMMSAIQSAQALQANATSGAEIGNIKVNGQSVEDMNPYVDTGLTGRYLESAALEFTGGQAGQVAGEPIVSIKFNDEGGELFEKITRENTGKSLAIFLDGEIVSAPRINEAISGGTAVISGGFNPEEAKALAQNLSFGALPVPITLASTQTIDATLGAGVINQSLMAGMVGFGLIAFFLILWYRLPGLVASIALLLYIIVNLAIFMVIPVTLTAAGLAGFVLSLGMAVDANVLVFERLKEEFRSGKNSQLAVREGFARAWSAIRDGNITGLLSAVILFWFGTAMIKGFALVLGIGIIVSVLSAIILTRTMLLALPDVKRSDKSIWSFLLGTGLTLK